MDIQEKNVVLSELLTCSEEAILNLDSDDSEKDEITLGLLDLCEEAALLPTKRRRSTWIKPWRRRRQEKGSFAFLSKELLLEDPISFQNYLRMSKQNFDILLGYVRQDIERSNTQLRDAIPAAEKLALTLRFLATGETYKSLDFQSRLSLSLISQTVPEVCQSIITRLKEKYLKFPSSVQDWEAIAKEFSLKWQFPNCLGALDGKHISFRCLRKDGAFYHNYKGTNSILLMSLIDADCRFIFVDVGCNGRTNDAAAFHHSPLKKIFDEGTSLPKPSIVGKGRLIPHVIIGDDAFPLQKHIMKPYPYFSQSKEKKIFNKRISRARHVVEHGFGILSNRFRVFLHSMSVKVETVELITLACCILHNFLLEHCESYISSIEDIPVGESSQRNEGTYNPRKGEAEKVRQQFMAYFNEEGKLSWHIDKNN